MGRVSSGEKNNDREGTSASEAFYHRPGSRYVGAHFLFLVHFG